MTMEQNNDDVKQNEKVLPGIEPGSPGCPTSLT